MRFGSIPTTTCSVGTLSHNVLCAVVCGLLLAAGCAQGEDEYAADNEDDAGPGTDLATDPGGGRDSVEDPPIRTDTDGEDESADADPPDFVPDPPPSCDPGLTHCGVQCANLQQDPDNCGGCGRTCVIPHASAGCAAGACILAQCDVGYGDRDGRLDNGCEAEILCEAGAQCATECGTTGAVQCVDDAPVCAAPAESCNAADDNCDGACDEGAINGCRVGVHRAYGNGHMYTTDLAAAGRDPYRLERENYFRVYAGPVPGTRPVFLCRKGDGKRFLTSDTACEMAGAPELQLGHWSPTQLCGAVPLYRLYHAPTNNHFFTLSGPERDNARDNLGYVTEGVAGWVWTEP